MSLDLPVIIESLLSPVHSALYKLLHSYFPAWLCVILFLPSSWWTELFRSWPCLLPWPTKICEFLILWLVDSGLISLTSLPFWTLGNFVALGFMVLGPWPPLWNCLSDHKHTYLLLSGFGLCFLYFYPCLVFVCAGWFFFWSSASCYFFFLVITLCLVLLFENSKRHRLWFLVKVINPVNTHCGLFCECVFVSCSSAFLWTYGGRQSRKSPSFLSRLPESPTSTLSPHPRTPPPPITSLLRFPELSLCSNIFTHHPNRDLSCERPRKPPLFQLLTLRYKSDCWNR